MPTLYFDFETCDPYLERGLGSGWVYSKVPGNDFKVLGVAYAIDDGEVIYEDSIEGILSAARSCDTLVAHNAQYDCGILYMEDPELFRNPGAVTVYDTEVGGRLCDSTLQSYGLAALGKKWLNDTKTDDELGQAIWDRQLFPLTKKLSKELEAVEAEGGDIEAAYQAARPPMSRLIKFAKTNLEKLQAADFELVARYAKHDVCLTRRLHKHLLERNDPKVYAQFSALVLPLQEARARGVRLDLNRMRQAADIMEPMIEKQLEEVYRLAGREFNINSSQQKVEVFTELGLDMTMKTATGAPSVGKDWLATQDHPVCQALVRAMSTKKLKADFVDKLYDLQQYTMGADPDTLDYGRLHPELNILRARTGRFSCTSPNVQQIPSRDEELGPLIRGFFVPEEGEAWYSLDFSSQENRLQVHYAAAIKAEGADELALRFNKDPNTDLYQVIADIAGIDRKHAKIITLGMSYGMGNTKLARQLGVSLDQAKMFRQQYNDAMPFLDALCREAEKRLKTRGHITTILGRKVGRDAPQYCPEKQKMLTFDYKALNKLIQGGAMDQTAAAMLWMHREGIPFLFPVHDEINISTSSIDKAKRARYIMEHAVDLCIPSVTDDPTESTGQSWGEAKYGRQRVEETYTQTTHHRES